MRYPCTPRPVAARVSYIVAYQELRRQHPRLSALALGGAAWYARRRRLQ